MYVTITYVKTIYEVIILKEKECKETVDKNFFKAVSYELAGEIGVIDNEDMKNNRKLISDKDKEDRESDKDKKNQK